MGSIYSHLNIFSCIYIITSLQYIRYIYILTSIYSVRAWSWPSCTHTASYLGKRIFVTYIFNFFFVNSITQIMIILFHSPLQLHQSFPRAPKPPNPYNTRDPYRDPQLELSSWYSYLAWVYFESSLSRGGKNLKAPQYVGMLQLVHQLDLFKHVGPVGAVLVHLKHHHLPCHLHIKVDHILIRMIFF